MSGKPVPAEDTSPPAAKVDMSAKPQRQAPSRSAGEVVVNLETAPPKIVKEGKPKSVLETTPVGTQKAPSAVPDIPQHDEKTDKQSKPLRTVGQPKPAHADAPYGIRKGCDSGHELHARISVLEQENERLREYVQAMHRFRRNWPRFYPVVHQDIKADIPQDRRRAVRMGLISWALAVAGYLLNLVVITLMFAANTDRDLMDWILACVMVILGLPLSWLLWYRSLYHSQIADSFAEYAKFFIHATVHIVWALWVIIAPPIWLGQSCAGIVNFWDINDARNGDGFKIFLHILNGLNIAVWAGSILLCANAFQFAKDAFASSAHARKKTNEGIGHLVGRMFVNMWSQGEVKEPMMAQDSLLAQPQHVSQADPPLPVV